MKFLNYLLLSVALTFCTLANSQVKTNFNSEEKLTQKGKFKKDYKTAIDLELPQKDIKQLLAKEMREKKEGQTKILRIAELVPIDVDMAKQIKWTYDEEFAYGKYTIKAKGALSVSINFDNFYLPEGTEMYAYNQDGKMITGPVTEAENQASKLWGSWVYKGDHLTIEVKTPIKSKEQLILHASSIAYGYKEMYKVAGFGASGPCEINVLCPLGNGWAGDRNSVALILIANGTRSCSGSMVMNTCSSNRPNFLTANHCYDFDPNVAGWRFTFQAWSATCSPSQNSNGVTFNGSVLRSRNAPSDFCLVELNNTPPSNSNIHYAGWNRSATPATQATAIHHPAGDVMKISRDNNGVIRASYAGSTNQHWRADWSPQDNGAGQIVTPVTEGGSSGSPLFDQNHRVIGQLSGGPSACGGTSLWDFYGSFDLSWTGGGTSTTRLSNWLDPGNTGAITTNTTNISALAAPITVSPTSLSISGASLFCSGSSTYTLNGAPTGSTISWETSDANVGSIPPPPYGTTVSVTKTGNGSITLTATVVGSCTKVTKTISIGLPVATISYGMSGSCNGSTQTWSINGSAVNNITSWQWTKDPSATGSWYIYSPSSPSTLVDVSGGGGGLRLTNTNSCGTSTNGVTIYSNCPRTATLTASPNPTTDNVNIAIADPKDASLANKKKAMMYQVKVTDQFGTVKKQYKYSSGTSNTNISLRGLISGMYTIQAFDGKSWSSVKVIKQ
jgi:hypothetical protein